MCLGSTQARFDLSPMGAYVAVTKVAHMSRRFPLYLILFLCLNVMSRELPECMNLEDDVSNDGDVAVYNIQPPLRVSSRADPADRLESSAFGNDSVYFVFPPPRCSRSAASARHAGIDLLRLLGQQRC